MLAKLFFFIIITIFFGSPTYSLEEPYCYVNDLPFDGDGWFINQKSLQKCFQEKQDIQTIIEVGSWLGASTRYLAELLPAEGKLYAIDTWLGSWSGSQAIFFQNDPRVQYAYQLFLSNIKHANLAHKIIPIRMFSLEAARALNVQADLIYIDACHEEESVYNDLLAWYPHLNKNGILCGDDWYWESVRNGVNRAAEKLNKRIFYEDNFWKLYD